MPLPTSVTFPLLPVIIFRKLNFLLDIGFVGASSIVHGKGLNLCPSSIALITCLGVLGTEMGHAAHPQLKLQGKESAMFNNHLILFYLVIEIMTS